VTSPRSNTPLAARVVTRSRKPVSPAPLAAILPRVRAKEAVACAERLRQMLMTHELIPHPNGAGRITVSLGVADAIKGDTPDFLLRRAGHGLKIAKREGRNRVVEMTPDGPVWDAERRA